MRAQWNVEGDHLMIHWSDVKTKYDAGWIMNASPYQEHGCAVDDLDMCRLSPFGGANWYAPAFADRVRPKPSSD